MLRIAVLVSGGGTNLQAIIDGVEQGKITNTEICCVISNNPGAYALKRAEKHKIEGVCISPADYRTREEFHDALLNKLLDLQVDLIVLAGVPGKDHQCASGADPVFLRNRLLWAESP